MEIPQVTSNVDVTEFVGEVVNSVDEDEVLWIDWYDFILSVGCYAYRNTWLEAEVDASYMTGNQMSFSACYPYDDDPAPDYNISLTYVPASHSPYGVDTIYMLSEEFQNAIYFRTDTSYYFEEYQTDFNF